MFLKNFFSLCLFLGLFGAFPTYASNKDISEKEIVQFSTPAGQKIDIEVYVGKPWADVLEELKKATGAKAGHIGVQGHFMDLKSSITKNQMDTFHIKTPLVPIFITTDQ